MVLNSWVLRDEIVNIQSMTRGGLPKNHSHQILICKKSPIKNKKGTPLLLDANKTKSPKFNLSKIGIWYYEKVKNLSHVLEYAALIDLQIKIKVSMELFTELGDKNFFSVWSPTAPVDYFQGNETGYLVVFRTYKLNKSINESLLSKGRAGKNFIFRLAENNIYELSQPVIADDKFDNMKQELLSILESNNSLVSLYSDNNPTHEKSAHTSIRVPTNEITEMAAKKIKLYPESFRRKSVMLAEQPDRTVADVANELGIHVDQINNWRTQFMTPPKEQFTEGGSTNYSKVELAEIRKLKVENTELKEENAELKEENAELKEVNAELKEENAELKEVNAELKEERVFLKKITAYFAKSNE